MLESLMLDGWTKVFVRLSKSHGCQWSRGGDKFFFYFCLLQHVYSFGLNTILFFFWLIGESLERTIR